MATRNGVKKQYSEMFLFWKKLPLLTHNQIQQNNKSTRGFAFFVVSCTPAANV